MKTVFTDRAPVAHAWAHGTQQNARYRDNFRCEGAKLYSYSTIVGYRFRRPDKSADRIGDSVAFLTGTSYSVTTSRHMRDAWRATRGMERYAVPDLDDLVTHALQYLAPAFEQGDSGKLARLESAFNADREAAFSKFGYRGYNIASARKAVAKWLGDNFAAINADVTGESDSWRAREAGGMGALAGLLADMAGFTQRQLRDILDKAERAEAERKAKQARREVERRIAKGKEIAAMADSDFAALFPADGGSDWRERARAEFGKELARLHKASKAAGYKTRTAELWRKVKLYRAHMAGHDQRERAKYRSGLAAQLRAWRAGTGKMPDSYTFIGMKAIHARLERAEAEQRERAEAEQEHAKAEAFAAWQAGDGKRPSEYSFADGSAEKAAILADMDSRRAAFLIAFDRWQAGEGERPAQLDKGDNRYILGGSVADTVKNRDAPNAVYRRAMNANQTIASAENAERMEAARLEAERKQAERFAADAEIRRAWLAGESDSYRARDGSPISDSLGGALMRVKGDNLETSWGASVPLAHAVKAYRFVKLIRERGKPWKRNGHTIRVGHYQVDSISASGDFVAGCHNFTWQEIERVAVLAGVAECPPSDAAEVTSH